MLRERRKCKSYVRRRPIFRGCSVPRIRFRSTPALKTFEDVCQLGAFRFAPNVTRPRRASLESCLRSQDCGVNGGVAESSRRMARRFARALARTIHPIEAYAPRVVPVHGETRDGSARIPQQFDRADGRPCKCVLRESLQKNVCREAGSRDRNHPPSYPTLKRTRGPWVRNVLWRHLWTAQIRSRGSQIRGFWIRWRNR